jgi:4-amino-4-deoxy-L-arabinose transferase-like glycosyltransferase
MWIALGVAVAVALRAPWMGTPLGRDEGGVALIALAWHHSGPFAYGPYFLDRPPLLVGLYRLAALADGGSGVRVLGALAAAGAVVLTTLLAVRIGGRRAAPVAALVTAVLVSSVALMAVFTPAELVAIVPSAGSVLCLVAGLERERTSSARLLLAGAGLLAGAALMVKQSFGDALAAGVVALAVVGFRGRLPRRELLARVGAYAGGVALVGLGLVLWEQLAHTPDESVWNTLFGFRLDAVHTLATGHVGAKLGRLTHPALASGLALGVAIALAGIATLRKRPELRAALAVWLVVGAVGVVLGGSYWPHYLIELVPVTAVGVALAWVRWPRSGAVAASAVAAIAVAFTAQGIRHEDPERYQTAAVTIGHYIRDRALPHETAYVLYARTNALYYSGLQSPFPYDWTLMMRAAPHAQTDLRTLLASPRRPTWIVEDQRPGSFGLDRGGQTKRLIIAHYRRVSDVCGDPVLLADGVSPRPAPPPGSCAVRT